MPTAPSLHTMRLPLSRLLPLASLLLIAAAQPDPSSVTITRVIDGDTLDAQLSGVRTPVGVLGIEAPPLNAPCGLEAQARLSDLVADGVVLVATDTAPI